MEKRSETGYDRGVYHEEPFLPLVDNLVVTDVRLIGDEIRGIRISGHRHEMYMRV